MDDAQKLAESAVKGISDALSHWPQTGWDEFATRIVTATIREAVLAERQRCEKVVRELLDATDHDYQHNRESVPWAGPAYDLLLVALKKIRKEIP